MTREEHLLEVYDRITKNIKARGGPCAPLVRFLTNKYGEDTDDLIQEIFADYLATYKHGVFDDTKSSINTYTIRFTKWRLNYYVRKHQAEKRKMYEAAESLDELHESLGDSFYTQNDLISHEPLDYLYEKLADLTQKQHECIITYLKGD